jgi:DME family drug/metabolite transporter
MKNPTLAGIAMALTAAGLWGTTGTAQTFASSQTSPYWIGALRLVIASIFFIACVLSGRFHQRGTGAMPAAVWFWAVLGGIAIAAYNLSFFAGVKASGVAVGTGVAIGSGPVWVGLLQALIARKTPGPVWWLGSACAVAGIGLMQLDGAAVTRFDGGGLGLCLLAGLAYASYTIIAKHLVGLTTPPMASFLVFSVAALVAVPVAALVSPGLVTSPATWLMVSYLGVVVTGVAFLLFSHALRRVSAASCVTLSLAEPVTAFVLAILVVGEQPGAMAYGGLGLVVLGLLCVVWTETRVQPTADRHSTNAGSRCIERICEQPNTAAGAAYNPLPLQETEFP